MTVSVLFGVNAATFAEARNHVESALGVGFEERESSFYGGVYFRFRGVDMQELVLQENIEIPENEPAEEEFPDERYLLYVSAAPVDSPFLAALEAAPDRFARLRTRVSRS